MKSRRKVSLPNENKILAIARCISGPGGKLMELKPNSVNRAINLTKLIEFNPLENFKKTGRYGRKLNKKERWIALQDLRLFNQTEFKELFENPTW